CERLDCTSLPHARRLVLCRYLLFLFLSFAFSSSLTYALSIFPSVRLVISNPICIVSPLMYPFRIYWLPLIFLHPSHPFPAASLSLSVVSGFDEFGSEAGTSNFRD
uniref:Uncharacterized protein n=1 Tax=Hippocampus comes TaxID=109280 RepID=A0A3Q2YTB5_HIPCM